MHFMVMLMDPQPEDPERIERSVIGEAWGRQMGIRTRQALCRGHSR